MSGWGTPLALQASATWLTMSAQAKMEATMRTVALDDDLAALIEGEKPLDEAAREALVMDLFRRRKVSTGKACELLGLERLDFVRRAAELGIPVYLTTEKEWEADTAALDAWRQQQS